MEPKEQEPKLDEETEREFDEIYNKYHIGYDIPRTDKYHNMVKQFLADKISQDLAQQKEDIIKEIDIVCAILFGVYFWK